MSKVNMLVPLDISLIDEGRFQTDLNKALANMQEQIIRHARQYGHKAKKAKAELTVKVSLICMEPEQEAYGCVAQLTTALPKAPPVATLLMSGHAQTGEDRLLCRQSGSTDDDPRQGVFATQDGKPVEI